MATARNLPRNALVTGGARRVGAAMARHLAEAGVNVAIHYHDSPHEAEALAAELTAANVRCVALKGDLTRAEEITALFGAAVAALGPIDLLVNNASAFEPDDAEDPDARRWDLHFAVHLKAPSLLAAEFARQNGLEDGLIVNLIDQRVWRLNPNFYSYTLSKSALWTATRTLAQALAPRIRVNAIGPGPTLPNERQTRDDFDRQVDGLLLKRSPALSEFGDTLLWLWRAKSVTGQMIALDGGQHLAWQTPDISGISE
ncbi:MAG: SDR family oxidoreductase [Nitratireductor sp.]|nr:SDR family oxidoreductase [Nitratireductor sp.]